MPNASGDFFAMLISFFQNFKLLFMVSPWEQAVRVRWGKQMSLVGPGFHWRWPFIDQIYVQSVRMRVVVLPKQTVTTKRGQTVTFCGSLGYCVKDLMQLYNTLHHAEATLCNLAMAAIGDYLVAHEGEEIRPTEVQEHASHELHAKLADYGLGDAKIYLTDFAAVRTYRLIGDYNASGNPGDSLQTTKALG